MLSCTLTIQTPTILKFLFITFSTSQRNLFMKKMRGEQKRILNPYFVICLKFFLFYIFTGKQNIEIYQFHVESFIMGNGSCSCYGNCSGKWWSEFSNPLLLLFSFLSTCSSLYSFTTAACIYILCSSYSAFVLLQGQGPDWQDFLGIICLLLINSAISFIEETNAGNAAASLMARLAPKAKVHSYKSKD